MKHIYYIASIMMLVSVLFSGSIQAQDDVLVVEWVDPVSDTLITNPLFRAIQADTLSDGTRNPNRVYQLRQGGFYYITEAIQNDGWHLRIEGEPGDPSDEFANPAMLQIGSRNDGTSPGKMFNVRGDFTLKNVIVNGKTTLGALQYEIIDVRADDATFVFDNVIFEFAQWGIAGIYSKNADIYFTNNTFRNFLSENQPWGGRGFSVWTDADSIWVENNTFHNIGGFSMQIEGATANYLMINQNTFVNNGRQVVLAPWVKEIYFTNNLLLNPFWQGEDVATEISADRGPDEQYSGMFAIEELPSQFGLDLQRRILIANNAFYTTSTYTDFYSEDGVRKQPLLSVEIEKLFDQYENMVVVNNYFDEQDPGLTNYADNDQDHLNFITDVRSGASPVRLDHYWDPGRDLTDNESIQWPLPEDLTYSNTTLQSYAIGDYPLGDLNWYPTEKSVWMENRQAQYDAIQAQLGGQVTVDYVGSVEAESGVYGGSAETMTMSDKLAARVAGGGVPEWTFDIAGGTYDIVVKQRTWYADNNPTRATNLVVNGGDPITFTMGIEITTDLPWANTVVEDVELVEGSNTIALARNWGYIEYESVTINDQDGNTVDVLYASQAALNDAVLVCSGSLCASGDALANVTDGSMEVTANVAENGLYTVKLIYLVPGGGEASADISVNGSAFGMETFATEDSTFAEVVLSNVEMTEGDNTISVSNVSGNLAIDKVDLFIINTTSVSNEQISEIANGFTLSQNYPNPFNPSTNINFTLPAATNVQLEVFNLLGQKVATLIDGRRIAGNHSVRFDASSMASGIYFYMLRAGEVTLQRKMTLIK